jgi:DNA-binding GntR family transcriptional regulator
LLTTDVPTGVAVAMKRYPKLTPRLDDVVHDQRRLLTAIIGGDEDGAERAAAGHVIRFEADPEGHLGAGAWTSGRPGHLTGATGR